MITVVDKYRCCGCAACIQVCPRQCININEDKQGFNYPKVDTSLCIDCGLCEKVCPVLHQGVQKEPVIVYAAKSKDNNLRLSSSSGGIFSEIATTVIADGGVVFGAKWNEELEVEHGYEETIERLEVFRGSKYVQSKIGNTYIQAKEFLKQGRKVLFSGTSCQIAGLRLFLGKEYDNLITIDVVCHGVPSPLIWRMYLKEVLKIHNNTQSISISFRDKSTGWKKFSVAFKSLDSNSRMSRIEIHNKNTFMQAFLSNLSIRPSCFNCPSKGGKCGSDISLADYWGIEHSHPEFDDDKGVSLVMVNSSKGMEALAKLDLDKIISGYDQALIHNPCITSSANKNPKYDLFWDLIINGKPQGLNLILKKCRPSYLDRFLNRIKRDIRILLHG